MNCAYRSEGSGRAGGGVNEGISTSIRIGTRVKGRAVCALICLSVLCSACVLTYQPVSIDKDLVQKNRPDHLSFAHPVPPDALDFDGPCQLFPLLVRYAFLCLKGIFPSASQACQTPGTFAIIKILVVIFILGIIDGNRSPFSGAG